MVAPSSHQKFRLKGPSSKEVSVYSIGTVVTSERRSSESSKQKAETRVLDDRLCGCVPFVYSKCRWSGEIKRQSFRPATWVKKMEVASCVGFVGFVLWS
jgi:hypothetical protein